jgi:hypothetical protein
MGCLGKMAHNVWQLGEVAEIEAKMFSFCTKVQLKNCR